MRKVARKILGWLSNIAMFLLIAMLLLFTAIRWLFLVTRARLFASTVPSTPLIKCEWTSDTGIWTHGFIEDFLVIEEHDYGKIVRHGDAAIITASYTKKNDSETVEARYEVPLETLDDIKAIFARSRMNAWPKMPEKLFGPVCQQRGTKWSLSFTFEGEGGADGRWFSFNDEQALPEKANEAVDEIRKILRVRRKDLSWRYYLFDSVEGANEE